MSKIDFYKQAKYLADQAREFANHANPDQSHDSRRYYDKLGFSFSIDRTWAGEYGNSSTHPWSDSIRDAVSRQIDIDLRSIIERAALRLEKEANERKKDAADEAREVLSEIDD